MIRHPHVKLSSLVMGLSSALDLVSPSLVHHHRDVTVFAGKIAAEMGLSDDDTSSLAVAAALHDIGLVACNEEFRTVFDIGDHRHGEAGSLLVRSLSPFARAGQIIRHHHVIWNAGEGAEVHGEEVPMESHILHLADRVAALLESEKCVLGQSASIVRRVRGERGSLFRPEVVDAFVAAAAKESFWLEAKYPTSSSFGIGKASALWNLELSLPLLMQLSEIFRCIIDFRSSTTATHSRSVACIAESLAGFAGFSSHGCGLIHVAGNLHDLGKLAVPVEVLEKRGGLTPEEIFIVRSHPFHTYRILSGIGGMEEVCAWASFHHECLDGRGYPFHLTEESLPLGSRIVAVADVFAALVEERSYRSGLSRDEVLRIMRQMAAEKKLDPYVFSIAEKNFEELCSVRQDVSQSVLEEFSNVRNRGGGTMAGRGAGAPV